LTGSTRRLPPGPTKLRITRGPEYQAVERELELRPAESRVMEIVLERPVNLRRRGWFAGDSHVHMIHGERTVPVSFEEVVLAARAEAPGFAPIPLSPFLDHPALVETITGLEDKDLVDGRTFERVRALLGDVRLTFRLAEARPR
jgi:hypothetical protein